MTKPSSRSLAWLRFAFNPLSRLSHRTQITSLFLGLRTRRAVSSLAARAPFRPMDYTQEPPHSDLLIIQAHQPFNAEPPVAALVEFEKTPEELVYCRNHGPVREFNQDNYRVVIRGGNKGETSFFVNQLKRRFQRAQVVASLQVCHQNFYLFS